MECCTPAMTIMECHISLFLVFCSRHTTEYPPLTVLLIPSLYFSLHLSLALLWGTLRVKLTTSNSALLFTCPQNLVCLSLSFIFYHCFSHCLTWIITETLGVGSILRCIITNIFGSDTKDNLRLTLSANPKAVSSATLDLSDTTNLALMLPGTAVNTTISKVYTAVYVSFPRQLCIFFYFPLGPGSLHDC